MCMLDHQPTKTVLAAVKGLKSVFNEETCIQNILIILKRSNQIHIIVLPVSKGLMDIS